MAFGLHSFGKAHLFLGLNLIFFFVLFLHILSWACIPLVGKCYWKAISKKPKPKLFSSVSRHCAIVSTLEFFLALESNWSPCPGDSLSRMILNTGVQKLPKRTLIEGTFVWHLSWRCFSTLSPLCLLFHHVARSLDIHMAAGSFQDLLSRTTALCCSPLLPS